MRQTMTTASRAMAFVFILALALLTNPTMRQTGAASATFTAPIATSFSTAVPADRASTIQLQGSDAEGTPLTYAITATPSHGTLGAISDAGVVNYTPGAGFVGADVFSYTVTSGGETSAAANITIAVTNAKTTVSGILTDASGNPRTGKITFMMTQLVTTPQGITPKGSSVSALLNPSGQFSIQVFPSRSLSPASYYNVLFTDGSSLQEENLGLYDIPASTTPVSLASYRVTDTNLEAKYVIPSKASTEQLNKTIALATEQVLLGDAINNRLQKYSEEDGGLRNSGIADTGSAVSILHSTTINGSLSTTGGISTPGTLNAGSTSITGSLNISEGSLSIDAPGTLSAGNTTVGSLSAGNTTINGTLNATGSISTTGDLSTTGDFSAGNFNLVGATKTLLDSGIGYSPKTIKGYLGFYDALELDMTDGDKVATWPDLSGNGRNATQSNPSLRLNYKARETEVAGDDLPYVSNSDGVFTEYLNVPIPASDTRTFFFVARHQTPFPYAYTANFDTNTWVSGLAGRWLSYRVYDGQGSQAIGYAGEWSVLCFRQNSATSVSFFVDGVLAQTYTPYTNPGIFTTFKLGPGAGRIRQFGVIDRAITDNEVVEHTRWLRARNKLTWRYEYIGRTGADYPPVLDSSPALIIRKEGFKGKRPLIFLNHQAGQMERMFVDVAAWRKLVTTLLDQGYIVAMSRMYSVNSGGENSWGNNDALQANVDLYNYALAHYQIDTTRVMMIGASMGGLNTSLAFADGRIPLRGASCFDCVFDLRHVYDNGFAGGIIGAYGITGATPNTYAEKTSGHDPRLLAASNWSAKRFRFYRNSGDTIVNSTENTGDFAAQISGVATESTVVTMAGNHLEGIESQHDDLVAFIKRCLQ